MFIITSVIFWPNLKFRDKLFENFTIWNLRFFLGNIDNDDNANDDDHDDDYDDTLLKQVECFVPDFAVSEAKLCK